MYKVKYNETSTECSKLFYIKVILFNKINFKNKEDNVS